MVAGGSNVVLSVSRDKAELIKPASPTPGGTFFIPNIDQQFFFHVDMLYVYKQPASGADTGDAIDHLRAALSKLLVPYYFVAGRFQVNEQQQRLQLNCNAAGCVFVAATCDSTIDQLGDLRTPNPELRKLIYVPDNVNEISDVPPVIIQVTRFSCGGVVVGTLSSHALFDGIAVSNFFYDYGLVARGEELSDAPSCDRTAFRARDPPQPSRVHPEFAPLADIPGRFFFNMGTKGILQPHEVLPDLSKRKVEAKFFPITSKMLASIKAKAMEDGFLHKCSSFEALSAHVWKSKAICLRDEEEPSSIAKLITTVNVRGKMKSRSVPKKFVGNGVAYACSYEATNEDLCTKPLSWCAKKIQDAVAAVDEEYVLSELDFYETLKHGVVDLFGGTIIGSVNRLPFHEVDFGWGLPAYAMPAGSDHELVEYVRLFSNCRNDGGLDLCLNMYSDKMQLYEQLLMQAFD